VFVDSKIIIYLCMSYLIDMVVGRFPI